jgi:hypothetical protein
MVVSSTYHPNKIRRGFLDRLWPSHLKKTSTFDSNETQSSLSIMSSRATARRPSEIASTLCNAREAAMDDDRKGVRFSDKGRSSSAPDIRSFRRTSTVTNSGIMMSGTAFDDKTHGLLTAMQVCMRRSLIRESIQRSELGKLTDADFTYAHKVRIGCACGSLGTKFSFDHTFMLAIGKWTLA